MKTRHVKPVVDAVATLAISLGLAGCSGNYSQTPPPGCGNNCPPSPEFLYATSPDHILAFTIDQSTGALGAPSAIPGPNQSTGMVSTVTLGHLYVSDFLNDTVDGFSVNATSGALTAMLGSPFPLGGTPPGAGGLSAIVPAGTYLYATDLNAGKVAGFAFDSASGKLTAVPGSPFVANFNGTSIAMFSINGLTGALVPLSPATIACPGGGSPISLALDGSGKFLFVAQQGSVTTAVFKIDPNSGVLSLASTAAVGNQAFAIAVVEERK